MGDENRMAEEIKKEKIRCAMLAGPSSVTAEATIAEMDHQGNLTVLRPGTNEWVCIPGDQNVVGRPDMALDPMGMVWFKEVLARKPKPTNSSPGLIYMLNGATQRSYTDPFDTTSPPIPIGPHWMILWPFDAKAAGLSPSIPVVTTDFAPGEHERPWPPISSTLIYGLRDAVLVDSFITLEQARAQADWIAAKGKNLTTIYATHGHGDHFFGRASFWIGSPKRALLPHPVQFKS